MFQEAAQAIGQVIHAMMADVLSSRKSIPRAKAKYLATSQDDLAEAIRRADYRQRNPPYPMHRNGGLHPANPSCTLMLFIVVFDT